MLLKITTTHQPATHLGYLLGKHPDRFQTKNLAFGKVHIFFPEATPERCQMAMLLDINALKLARSYDKKYAQSFALANYVNDRPYVASSFMTTAIAKVLGSAMNGNCKTHPELAETPLPLTAEISVIAAKGGETIIRRFFEPLGYEVSLQAHVLDANFPDWGASNYFDLKLEQTVRLSDLLTHLFVLLPALDANKHYFISEDEIEKLLTKGGEWLKKHREYQWITRRYLRNKRSYANAAIARLAKENAFTEPDTEGNAATEKQLEKTLTLHQIRHQAVIEQLKKSGAKSVIDLGCNTGKLLKELVKVSQFERIVGYDVSHKALQIAHRKLYLENASERMRERLQLWHGSLTYRDRRIEDFDAAVLVEVIEHLEENRLRALERIVFACAKPSTVIVTTPNRAYNVLFPTLAAGKFRHPDHRFEWTRAEFQAWTERISQEFGYQVARFPIGEVDKTHGAPTQMAVFKITI